MATTTNYSWSTPDDTALVKDGASAIRTLGSSADTTVKNLNPETTLGDLAYRSSTANVKTRLGLGTAGQVLTVNSGATAPEWATSPSGGITLLNSGGTTLTGSSVTISSIPATYTDLRIVVRNFVPVNDNDGLRMRFNADAGASRHVTNSAISASTTFNDTSIRIANTSDNAANSSFSVSTIYDYANTVTFKSCQTHASVVPLAATPTTPNAAIIHSYYNQTTAISSLEFLASGGNMTSGTVFVYGVK